MTSGFRKGDKVTFAPGVRQGWMNRPITREELQAWADSPRSKGMNDAGETKLPPRGVARRADLHGGIDQIFTVVRARVVNRIGWRSVGGHTLVIDKDGVEWHIRRDELVKVEG